MSHSKKPRRATAADLDAVRRMAEGIKPFADLQAHNWTQEHELLVLDGADGISSFLLLRNPVEHPITGDWESVILGWFAPQLEEQQALFQFAAEAARAQESQYLIAEIDPGQAQQLELVESLGYRLESYKISVATADCSAPQGSPYSVRACCETDEFAIAVLNSTVLTHTLSAGREYDLTMVTFRSMGATFQQVKRRDPQCLSLVLVQDEALVGYLLLSLSEASAYINDLAISPEHWGGKGVLHLMRAGSQQLFQRNIPLLIGDVSASNLRALKIAQRYLGFAVDSRRYGLTINSGRGFAAAKD